MLLFLILSISTAKATKAKVYFIYGKIEKNKIRVIQTKAEALKRGINKKIRQF